MGTIELVGIIIGGILGGTAVAALINQIGEGVRQRRKRAYDTEDTTNEDIAKLKKALMWMLYDRIRFIGQSYINGKCIDFDDRRVLNAIHDCYHSDLGGNGDLDVLMKEVNSLPLKSS